jgi:cytochrome b/b6/petD-like protein
MAVGGFFLLLSPLAYIQHPPELSSGIKELVNSLSGPVTLTVGSLAAMAIFFFGRRFFTKPPIAWAAFNLSLLLMGMSITDPNFAAIVTKPDNVPIVGLVFLLGFFTWLGTYRAVINDDRRRQGLPPVEKTDDEKVLVWPDLVYTEMICMVALTAFLVVWGIALQAPLEEPASSVKTPNPSKAPWYFLGLQEMLVYYDPWMAGVVLPSVVIFGLMAIPFLDFNKKGNGYYTIEERPFSYIVFQLGFLELWVVLIILGTFLRGPNWNFFGPFETWDAHKVLAQNNVDLSQYFWINWLQTSMPRAPTGTGKLVELGYIAVREFPGIALVLGYFLILPPLMATTIFRKFFVRMGFVRYMLMSNLLLLMVALPLKMVLRWTCNLKYLIHIDEYFLNF